MISCHSIGHQSIFFTRKKKSIISYSRSVNVNTHYWYREYDSVSNMKQVLLIYSTIYLI